MTTIFLHVWRSSVALWLSTAKIRPSFPLPWALGVVPCKIRGAVAEWVRALAWAGDRTVPGRVRIPPQKTFRFGTLAINSVYPALPESSDTLTTLPSDTLPPPPPAALWPPSSSATLLSPPSDTFNPLPRPQRRPPTQHRPPPPPRRRHSVSHTRLVHGSTTKWKWTSGKWPGPSQGKVRSENKHRWYHMRHGDIIITSATFFIWF